VVNAGHEDPQANSLREDFQAVTNVKYAKSKDPSYRFPSTADRPSDVGELYVNPLGKLLRAGLVQPFRGSILAAGVPIKWFFEELPDRLARFGGLEGQRFATLAREVVSQVKRLLGKYSTQLDPALRTAGRYNEFTSWVNDTVVDPKNRTRLTEIC